MDYSQPEPPRGTYDFIVNPNSPQPKPGKASSLTQNPFFKTLGLIIGGALLVMVVIILISNLFLKDKTNLADPVGLVQDQTELIRLNDQITKIKTQDVRNASITTQLSMTTQRQEWLDFLKKHKRKVPPAELKLKKSAAVDQQLKLALETSTFDSTLSQVIREQLEEYSRSLADAHDRAISNSEKAMINKHYDQTQLLLKQWPSS